jgi:CHAT domain-containing protein
VNLGILMAVLGSALTALSLTGSTRNPAISQPSLMSARAKDEIRRLNDEGRRKFAAGQYLEARDQFRATALIAERSGDASEAATNWSNAGGCSLVRQDFRTALGDFLKARQIAETSSSLVPLAFTLNNLASLYLQMGNPEAALQVATEALDGPAGTAKGSSRPKLQVQWASALSALHRFDEAKPVWREAINQLEEQGDLDAAPRVLASYGSFALDADRIDEADSALTEAFRIVRIHHIAPSANILRGLARVRSRQGDARSASTLFDAAIAAPPGLTPLWVIYADRGEFRLANGDLLAAVTDFRKARRLAHQMRADIVPADQDRIALESGLSRIASGLVEAGNRLARQTADSLIPGETFEAAEQDRLWSLRALLPSQDDWRTHLPGGYWDLLARYQAVERKIFAKRTQALDKEASSLRLQLEQNEAKAAGLGPRPPETEDGALHQLARIRKALDSETVLFSFQFTKSGGWLWAIDRRRIDVFPIPSSKALQPEIIQFSQRLRKGYSANSGVGERLFQELFGGVPTRYLAHTRWLLELDGPLFDLPFASLQTRKLGSTKRGSEPIYLVERASLQVIPSALMLEQRKISPTGEFLGVGDPIYNTADSRYHGERRNPAVALPRLPGTGTELEHAARAWGSASTRILTGEDAKISKIQAEIRLSPSIIHFATHIIPAPGDFASGLIALSIDRSGAMGLMGPSEIIAHRVNADLVVLNGCHSGQGETLPGTGLMGLTRAWIGAGAGAVLATRWEIPDGSGEGIMVDFYRNFKQNPELGPAYALRQAQLAAIRNRGSHSDPALWSAWFLLAKS